MSATLHSTNTSKPTRDERVKMKRGGNQKEEQTFFLLKIACVEGVMQRDKETSPPES